MALTDAQTVQIYEIFGVPRGGSAEVVSAVATIFGPVCESLDFTAVVTKIDLKLSTLSAEQIARVTTLLTRWDAITSTSPLRVTQSSSTRGIAADHPAERASIRAALSNLVGVSVPGGGFVAEAARSNQTTLGR